jgi:hypothetical protein
LIHVQPVLGMATWSLDRFAGLLYRGMVIENGCNSWSRRTYPLCGPTTSGLR